MSPTRRRVLLAGTTGLTALAGCSVLTDPGQPLVIAVTNYTDEPYHGHVRIETDDGALGNQYLDVAPADPDDWASTARMLSVRPSAGSATQTVVFADVRDPADEFRARQRPGDDVTVTPVSSDGH